MGCDDIVKRAEIQRFAEAMQITMDKYQKEKEDSWKKMSFDELRKILTKEIEELPEGLGDVGEYVDVANICMMLWYRQVCLGLEFEGRGEKQ